MFPMDDDHLLFISSPKLKNLQEAVDKKLYLSEIPIYDSTRQFLLVNQIRSEEVDHR